MPNAPGPELPLTSKCPNAAPPPWGRPRRAFTSVITSHEPSAGRYALELYVRYACTPGASRAAPRRITAHARSTPPRAQVQRLGPVHGWAAPSTGFVRGFCFPHSAACVVPLKFDGRRNAQRAVLFSSTLHKCSRTATGEWSRTSRTARRMRTKTPGRAVLVVSAFCARNARIDESGPPLPIELCAVRHQNRVRTAPVTSLFGIGAVRGNPAYAHARAEAQEPV